MSTLPLGMPPRTRSSYDETRGTGLELYIVQEVIAAHGGQITVQSTVGAGTTFTLTLPVAGAGETT